MTHKNVFLTSPFELLWQDICFQSTITALWMKSMWLFTAGQSRLAEFDLRVLFSLCLCFGRDAQSVCGGWGGLAVTTSRGSPHGGGGSDPRGPSLGFGVWWISVPTRRSRCWSVTAMWLQRPASLNESIICSIKSQCFAKMHAFVKTERLRGWSCCCFQY